MGGKDGHLEGERLALEVRQRKDGYTLQAARNNYVIFIYACVLCIYILKRQNISED